MVPPKDRTIACLTAMAASLAALYAQVENETLFKTTISPYATLYTVDASIGSVHFKAMIDTGANMPFIDQSLNAGFDNGKEILRQGAKFADGSRGTTPFLKIPGLKVQSLELTKPTVGIVNLTPMARYVDTKAKMLLGVSAFTGSKLMVNYDEGFLELYKGPSKLPKEGWSSIPLFPEQKYPYFRSRIEGRQIDFQIDTGFNGTMSLSTVDFYELVKSGAIILSAHAGNLTISPGISPKTIRQGWFTRGTLLGRELAGLSVSETSDKGGDVGLCFLQAFNFEIDFSSHQFRYQLRNNPTPPPDIDFMLGARLSIGEDGLRVEALQPDGKGAAQAIGMKKGDLITALDSQQILDAATLARLIVEHAGKPLKVNYNRQSENMAAEMDMQVAPMISGWDYPGKDTFGVSKE